MSDDVTVGDLHGLSWSATRSKITKALLEAQRERMKVARDGTDQGTRDANGNFVRYVTLENTVDVLEPLLNKHGLLITNGTRGMGPLVTLVTVELSLAGTEEWVRTSCVIGLARKVPREDAKLIEGSGKSLGGAITTGRRHLLIALVNAVASDAPQTPPHPADGDAPPPRQAAPPPNNQRQPAQGKQRGPGDIDKLYDDVKRVAPELLDEMDAVLSDAGIGSTDPLPKDSTKLFGALWKRVGDRFKAAKAAAEHT